MNVVPDPSARRTTAIGWSGKASFGFSAAIALSFHLAILPR